MWLATGTLAGSSPPPAHRSPAPPACLGPGSVREAPSAAQWSLSAPPGTQVCGQHLGVTSDNVRCRRLSVEQAGGVPVPV